MDNLDSIRYGNYMTIPCSQISFCCLRASNCCGVMGSEETFPLVATKTPLSLSSTWFSLFFSASATSIVNEKINNECLENPQERKIKRLFKTYQSQEKAEKKSLVKSLRNEDKVLDWKLSHVVFRNLS